MSHFVLTCSVLFLAFLHAVCGNVETIDGQLVRIVDKCTPGDDSTCPSGKCCVKEGLAYIPEDYGPKPAYEIACKPYRQQGESCYPSHVHTNTHTNTHEICPCAPSLNCTSHGILGRCQ